MEAVVQNQIFVRKDMETVTIVNNVQEVWFAVTALEKVNSINQLVAV